MTSTPARHVESLTYSHTITSEVRRFVDDFRQVVHLGGFHCEVEDATLVAKPIHHMSSLENAQASLEPHLAGWALRSELLSNFPATFKKTGHVVRDEVDGQVVGVGVAEEVNIAEEVKAVLTTSRLAIPEGPPISITEEVESIRARWRDVAEGRERLLVGAYWVLTEIERYYGNRSDAAQSLGVSSPALNQLGKLANQNDPEHGRKARSAAQPLSPEEIRWIWAFVPLLILRVAEVESDLQDLPQITMDTLPPLAS